MVLQFLLAVSAVAALVDYVVTTLERLINWFRNSRLGHVVEALKIMGQYIEHAKVHGMLSAAQAIGYRSQLRIINNAQYKERLLASNERGLYNEAVKMEREMEPYLPEEESGGCVVM